MQKELRVKRPPAIARSPGPPGLPPGSSLGFLGFFLKLSYRSSWSSDLACFLGSKITFAMRHCPFAMIQMYTAFGSKKVRVIVP